MPTTTSDPQSNGAPRKGRTFFVPTTIRKSPAKLPQRNCGFSAKKLDCRTKIDNLGNEEARNNVCLLSWTGYVQVFDFYWVTPHQIERLAFHGDHDDSNLKPL